MAAARLAERLFHHENVDPGETVSVIAFLAGLHEFAWGNPSAAVSGGKITRAQFLSAFDITDPADVAAVDKVVLDAYAGTLGRMPANNTTSISAVPTKAEVQSIQATVNAILNTLRPILGLAEAASTVLLAEIQNQASSTGAKFYTIAQLKQILGV